MPLFPDITALVCTYNRAADLRELLETLLKQETGGRFTYDVLVVDNNSRDETRAVAESFVKRDPERVRYIFEGRQGKSHALNTALDALRSGVYVMADDDFLFPPDALAKFVHDFRQYPEIACVGGQVKPRWRREPPAWLTEQYYGALALTNWGEQPFWAGPDRRICFIGAGYRTEVARAVGGYHVELGVDGKLVGSMEDADLFDRMYAAGYRGYYDPSIELFHKVEAERVEKAYHRRWHVGHGSQFAVMDRERAQAGRLPILGTPAYFYRQALRDLWHWTKGILRGQETEAFWHELQLHHFAGYWRKRREQVSR